MNVDVLTRGSASKRAITTDLSITESGRGAAGSLLHYTENSHGYGPVLFYPCSSIVASVTWSYAHGALQWALRLGMVYCVGDRSPS